MSLRICVALATLLAVGSAHAQSKRQLKAEIAELKERLERSERTIKVQEDQIRADRANRSAHSTDLKKERDLLREQLDLMYREMEKAQRRDHERSVKQNEWITRSEAERHYLEAQALRTAQEVIAVGKAMARANAALRAKGLEVPGETRTQERLRETIGLEVREGMELGKVLGDLGEGLGLRIVVLGDDPCQFPLKRLKLRDVPVKDVLDALTAAIFGTARRVAWRVEGPLVVFEEVERQRSK